MSEKSLRERKEYFRVLLGSMPLEDKVDELGELTDEDLQVLLGQFLKDEDYEICQAIKVIQDLRKSAAKND